MRYELKTKAADDNRQWEDLNIETADLPDDQTAQAEAQRLANASGYQYRWNRIGSGQGHYVFPHAESDILTRKLSFGVYAATAKFRAIDQHACVCFADDMGLVASTGPAGDAASEKYAELFAAAPDLLAALDLCYTRIFNFGMDSLRDPQWTQKLNNEAMDAAKAAIAKARGE